MGGNSTVQRAVDSWHMNESCPYDLDDEQNKQIQAFMTIYLKNLTNKGKEKERNRQFWRIWESNSTQK